MIVYAAIIKPVLRLSTSGWWPWYREILLLKLSSIMPIHVIEIPNSVKIGRVSPSNRKLIMVTKSGAVPRAIGYTWLRSPVRYAVPSNPIYAQWITTDAIRYGRDSGSGRGTRKMIGTAIIAATAWKAAMDSVGSRPFFAKAFQDACKKADNKTRIIIAALTSFVAEKEIFHSKPST
tara:strand:+ start:449 stop:979 length:531 start_codon:yes stop_codon:yes gene_type:complete